MLLTIVMVLGLLPTAAIAAPVTGRVALSGVGNLQNYPVHQKADDGQNG